MRAITGHEKLAASEDDVSTDRNVVPPTDDDAVPFCNRKRVGNEKNDISSRERCEFVQTRVFTSEESCDTNRDVDIDRRHGRVRV